MLINTGKIPGRPGQAGHPHSRSFPSVNFPHPFTTHFCKSPPESAFIPLPPTMPYLRAASACGFLESTFASLLSFHLRVIFLKDIKSNDINLLIDFSMAPCLLYHQPPKMAVLLLSVLPPVGITLTASPTPSLPMTDFPSSSGVNQ